MYDFENRLVQAGAGIAIVHDGDANRVSGSQQRVTGGPSVSLPNSPPMEDRSDLQRSCFASVDDQIRLHREKSHVLSRKISSVMTGTWSSC